MRWEIVDTQWANYPLCKVKRHRQYTFTTSKLYGDAYIYIVWLIIKWKRVHTTRT